jgi:23S rRNA pseudouridine1911/1915/1917 synthase
MTNSTLHFQVEIGISRVRLDDFLFGELHNLSRMYLRELVKSNRVLVNGEFENIGHKLKTNDFVEVEADLSRGTAMQPENVPLDIVFEDDAIVVVNKAAGMLVHPTHRDKNGTLLNALTFYLNRSYSRPIDRISGSSFIRPGLVHRLDKQTSGLMVVAKTMRAHRILADHFKRKLVEKRYLALIEGVLTEDEGVINAPIGRYAEAKLWDVDADGKQAETRFRVRQRFADTTLVELEPVTGRTNQLRIHCAHVGHAIVGDVQRGGREFERLCLHAFRLAFNHPIGGQRMEFEARDGAPLFD